MCYWEENISRGCLIIIWTGPNIKIGIAQKVYELWSWFFLPKWLSYQGRILAKEQFHNSYTFWTMPILISSPVQIIMTHPLIWERGFWDNSIFSHLSTRISTLGQSMRNILDKVTKWYFLSTLNRDIWSKKIKLSCRGKKSHFGNFFKMGWDGCALLVRPSRIPQRNSKINFVLCADYSL